MIEALEVLENTPGIGISRLDYHDVVRHDLVQAIVQAYDTYEKRGKEK
jgi:phosphate starvation-inducible PhoH-like protein